MSHRKSNEGDLKIKYDYLYTLASKVSSEAKLIMVKRKVDPDKTMMSYMQQQQLRADNEYVLDSEYSSDEEIEERLQDLDLSDDDFLEIGEDTLALLDSEEPADDLEGSEDSG
jgi:hypothetical protein